MKNLILTLILLIPFTAMGQLFEAGIGGGGSTNTVPAAFKEFNKTGTGDPVLSGGINPVAYAFCNFAIYMRFRLGLSVTYLRTSAYEQTASLKKRVYFTAPSIQFTPRLSYVCVASPKTNLSLGILGGLGYHTQPSHNSAGPFTIVDATKGNSLSWVAGFTIHGRQIIYNSLGIFIDFSPAYNHFSKLDPSSGPGITGSTSLFTYPATMGLCYDF